MNLTFDVNIFIFGLPHSGKTTLINAFEKRSFTKNQKGRRVIYHIDDARTMKEICERFEPNYGVTKDYEEFSWKVNFSRSFYRKTNINEIRSYFNAKIYSAANGRRINLEDFAARVQVPPILEHLGIKLDENEKKYLRKLLQKRGPEVKDSKVSIKDVCGVFEQSDVIFIVVDICDFLACQENRSIYSKVINKINSRFKDNKKIAIIFTKFDQEFRPKNGVDLQYYYYLDAQDSSISDFYKIHIKERDLQKLFCPNDIQMFFTSSYGFVEVGGHYIPNIDNKGELRDQSNWKPIDAHFPFVWALELFAKEYIRKALGSLKPYEKAVQWYLEKENQNLSSDWNKYRIQESGK